MAALCAIVTSRAVNPARAQNPNALSKIAPWVLDHTVGGQQAEYLVVLSDQADFSGAAALRTKQEKGRYVRDVLWSKGSKHPRTHSKNTP